MKTKEIADKYFLDKTEFEIWLEGSDIAHKNSKLSGVSIENSLVEKAVESFRRYKQEKKETEQRRWEQWAKKAEERNLEYKKAEFQKHLPEIYANTLIKSRQSFLENNPGIIRSISFQTGTKNDVTLAKDKDNLLILTSSQTEFGNVFDEDISNPTFKVTKLPVSNIIYFKEKGDVQFISNVQGGGGYAKDVSIGGAVIGGLLFGMAGVIVGSRIGTDTRINPIYTTAEKIDTRFSVFRYIESDGETVEIVLEHCFYDALKKIIPDKEYDQVALNLPNVGPVPELPEKNNQPTLSDFELIKHFKELLDLGIVTQEEFDKKKKEILGL